MRSAPLVSVLLAVACASPAPDDSMAAAAGTGGAFGQAGASGQANMAGSPSGGAATGSAGTAGSGGAAVQPLPQAGAAGSSEIPMGGAGGAMSTAGQGGAGGAMNMAGQGGAGGTPEPEPLVEGSWHYTDCGDVDYPMIDSNNGNFPPGSCPPPEDLAPSCPMDSKVTVVAATASSFETAFPHPPEYSFDEYLSTRWSSNVGPEAWLTLDLGSVQTFQRLYLLWELAHGMDYDIEVSDDGETFTTLTMVRGGDGFQDILRVDGSGRYLRMNGIERGSTGDVPQCCAAAGTLHGYSLFDFTICAQD